MGQESAIDIYLRMRPAQAGRAVYELDAEEGRVQWTVPRHMSAGAGGIANHLKERYEFLFSGIFDTQSSQDTVFDVAARKVVTGSLDGYNGTIFAYGQTGSGKTFTITGGAERYADRGIIPRAISLIYSELAKRSEYTYSVHISYLEIYNETGYDLLNPDHETKALEDLPKVILLEDEENNVHLRNLSAHLATNEEEALNLLFVGDTNRMISSTPMNMASSRSHCIFIVNIEARKAGEDKIHRSKLHLVDLAGSERVSKTGVDGQILKEAKYINLSLHFLEQVIIALQERSQGKLRHHIPYRNSMITSVLRDSLGGNCHTVMLATVSISQDQLLETLSTCRFAQRVAMVSNEVSLNEEVDPTLVIRRLKQEIKDLKAEIQILRGEHEERGPLNEYEVEQLRKEVLHYVNNNTHDAHINFGASMINIRTIFQIFKELLNAGPSSVSKSADSESDSGFVSNAMDRKNSELLLHETIQNLQQQIQQRDNEIDILVSFIRKRELAGPKSCAVTHLDELKKNGSDSLNEDSVKTGVGTGFTAKQDSIICEKLNPQKEESTQDALCSNTPHISPMLTRQDAFQIFLKNNLNRDAMEENKGLLKKKIAEAKFLGNCVNHTREKIQELKSQIEKHRINCAIQGLLAGDEENSRTDIQEHHFISTLEIEKKNYKESFSKLRDLKKEIEQLQLFLKQSNAKIQGRCKLEHPPSDSTNDEAQVEVKEVSAHMVDNDNPSSQGKGVFIGRKADFEQWFNMFGSQQGLHERFPPCLKLGQEKPTSKSENSVEVSHAEYSDKENMNDLGKPLYKTKQESLAPNQIMGYTPKFESESNLARKVVQSPGNERSMKVLPKERDQGILLTGDESIDANILAFYEARTEILKLNQRNVFHEASERDI